MEITTEEFIELFQSIKSLLEEESQKYNPTDEIKKLWAVIKKLEDEIFEKKFIVME